MSSPGNLACATLLLCATACADPDVGTLVRYQGGKPNASWDLQATSHADGGDAGERRDASTQAPADAGRDEADAGDDFRDAGAQSAASASCSFRVTTRAQGGRYAPKNIGAIWIERADGTWLKTLKVWAGVRLRYLTTYLESNSARDTTDAMTSATLRQHASHEVRWNLSDAQGEAVPDGDYRVRVEVTDRSGKGQLLSVPFHKSSAALTLAPDDSEFFVDVELRCS